jgi:hypothetical protein
MLPASCSFIPSSFPSFVFVLESQVLLFPAMKPDETSDPKQASMHKAARALATTIRTQESKTRGEVIIPAPAASGTAAAGAGAAH